MVNINNIRNKFIGTQDKTYLDSAAIGMVSTNSEIEIQNYLKDSVACQSSSSGEHYVLLWDRQKKVRYEAAKLLNCDEKNIALIESTTHGLNIASNSIPISKNDNVIIADTEFLQVAIPWYKKSEEIGFTIKNLKSGSNGEITLIDIISLVDKNTKVICISSVQWCTGFRLDMIKIGDFCKENNIFLVVDAVQEMGVLEINMAKRYADFLIAGGHKWLMSPFGLGVMYLSDKVLTCLSSTMYGYRALIPPKGGWGEYYRDHTNTPHRKYEFNNTARKFEIAGTANYIGAAGLGASIELINEIGISNIENHVKKLGEILKSGLNQLGMSIISDHKSDNCSGITTFSCYNDPNLDNELLIKLQENKIYMAQRFSSGKGGLRVSIHCYNNENDILNLIENIKKNK